MNRKAAFVERYGAIYEHSPWVAEQAWREDLDERSPSELAGELAEVVDAASEAQRLLLIRAHPDLADRAGVAEPLTASSQAEQASAGIDQCNALEFAQFQDLNHRYKKKFGFPFIMAVRGSNRHEILAAFAERIHNTPQQEFAKAMTEIHKIARLRLAAMEENHE